jgi:hypothetical protein
MRSRVLVHMLSGLVTAIVCIVPAAAVEEPRVILPGGEQQLVPVGEEGPGDPWFVAIDGRLALNLPAGPLLVVAVPAGDPHRIHGAELLIGATSDAEVIAAAENFAVQFPHAEPLQSVAGGPFLNLERGGGAELPSNPDCTIQFATAR